ncbi:MAG TPA: ImmA/IrrE family metallo-endopeptidase [Terriglobales bacterium]|nr:ImmA/IrrE family metallo-endopeptidase [Terriglobales bacterium]
MAASTKQEIEMAAEQCRQHWNLGVDGPIQELRTVLEAAGAIVIDHVVKSTKVDTFSRYNASMAMIFPNEQTQSRSAWNFDVAHELGHIAMHRGTRTGDKDTERKADMFAGAFLMPSEAFGREFQAITFSWEHVFRLKKRWGVRAAAIVKRAFDLSLMGAVDCQAASKHIYREGWNKAEPDDSRAQQSGVFENALNCLGQKETLTIDLPIEKLCAQLFFTRDTFFDVTGISITQSNIAPSTNADQTVVVAASTPKPALQPVPQVAERRDMSVSTPLKPLGLRTTGICGRQDCARQAKVEFRATRFCIEHLTQEVIAATSEPLGNVQGTPSGVYGLETIPQGCKAFFLVHGDQNAVCPRRCEQLAVGVETWHCAYAHLPAFASVERLWVVLNDNEENRAFLISIAADKVIRRRCRVSIRGVQWVAKQRMLCQRRWRYSEHFNPSNDAIFEEGLEFQDCPVPSEIYKLDQLGRPKEEQDKPRQNIDWRS